MEPDDNFSLINSYNNEESHPRQLPKAVTCTKVNPTPLVPDVSLVLGSNHKDVRNHSNKGIGDSEPLQEEGYIHKSDDSAPRRVKPMPIASFPNETYAAWKARALNTQNCIKSRLAEATFESTSLKSCANVTSENLAAVNMERDAPSVPTYVKSLSHRAIRPALENSNHMHSTEQNLTHQRREIGVVGTKMSLQKESIPEMYSIQTNNNPYNNKTGTLDTSQGTTRYCREMHPKTTLVRREGQPSYGILNEVQSLPNHPMLISERNGNNEPQIRDQMKRTEYSHDVQPPKELLGDFERSHSLGESLITAKGEGSSKKRDALRDLYRIVQLQNEELKALQSQVEKLLKRELLGPPKLVEPIRSRERRSVVLCVEESTQTYDIVGKVSSVGVMTSFIESSKACVSFADAAPETNPTCKCKGCPGSVANGGTATTGKRSNEGNAQERNRLVKYRNATNNPVSKNYDSSRSYGRNTNKIHQVIEEESESDDSTNKLNGEMASQTNDNYHQSSKAKVQQGNFGGKGCALNQNKSPSGCSNAGRPTREVRSSGGGKTERRNPNSDTASLSGKRAQGGNGQNCKQLEGQKCCPEHNTVNRKARHLQNDDELTMTLNEVELQTVTEPQLSPEPSIHVDIQDYHEFSGEVEGKSDEDSFYSENDDFSSESEGENPKNGQIDCDPSGNIAGNQDRSNENAKVGWTFYNNVLGQVTKLLENQEHSPPAAHGGSNQDANVVARQTTATPAVPPGPASRLPSSRPQLQYPGPNNQIPTVPSLEAVREATLQRLKQLGVDFSDDKDNNAYPSQMPSNNMPNPGVMNFHDSRRVTFNPASNRGRTAAERHSSDTSLKLKALAQKYLSDEQLAKCGYLDVKSSSQPEPQQVSEQSPGLAGGMVGEMSSSADFTLYGLNGTNLSFATLRYLQRYQLLPGTPNDPAGIWRHQDRNQQMNFMEATAARGADVGETRSPGQIGYSHDYMEGFRQGANMAMGRNGQGVRAHSSTPANRIDHVLPSTNMADGGKEMVSLQNRGDFHLGSKEVGAGNQAGHSEKKVAAKHRSRGKQRGQQIPRDRNGCERNGHQNPCVPRKADSEKSPRGDILGENNQNQRLQTENLKSSNILDITALRQQPKLI